MQDYMYSVISFVAVAIHLIINFDLLLARRKVTTRGTRFRGFLAGILVYYLTDAAWGILAGLGWIGPLYADTVLYFIALAVSVLLWCLFVISYLCVGKWTARILSGFGYALMAFFLVVLMTNPFNHCLFYFDEQGKYIAGNERYMAFSLLIVFNAILAIFVFVKALGNRKSGRRRNMMVFLFCLTMTVAIILQVAWPLLPFYALGCLIGNCFLHVFVVEDERAELRKAVIEHEQTAKHMAELEKALERARAAEKARSMFFSIVSHDIRTPLNAILGYSELIQDGIKSQAEKDEALKSIRVSGTTLLKLVNDVLDLAKMDAGKMTLQSEPVRLAQLTDEVFASFRMNAEGKGVKLVNQTAGVPTVLLDGHRFHQILFNLIGNAVKFTARGSVTVAASYSDMNLEVAVSDTGCGIPSDMLTRILDPFVQVQDPSHSVDRAGGTGLGLSICRRLVEVMGGELVVESELGKGSTFKIRIPRVATSEEKTNSVIRPKNVAALETLPKHVLVIDDSSFNRSVLTAFLKKAGIVSIDQAGDGVEAFTALDSAVNAGHPHDFILSDLWMPNMNGTEFIEKLRADSRYSRLPVFAVTADTEFQDDDRTGLFNGVLLKPLTYSKLMEVFTAKDCQEQQV